MSSSLGRGRGRGRGRGNTLPAWMTRGDGPSGGAPPDEQPTYVLTEDPGHPESLPPSSTFDKHAFDRERERALDHRGGRWEPRERELPPFRSRDGPSPRDVMNPSRDFRRDVDRDARGGDGIRGYDHYSHGGISNFRRGESDRGTQGDFGRGLGFVPGEGDRRIAWERDLGGSVGRGRGRGRGRGGGDGEGPDNSMNFVRGEVLNRDGPLCYDRRRELERDDRGRDWSGGSEMERDFERDWADRDRKFDRSDTLHVRDDRGDNSDRAGKGNGRGRGRGMHVNRPAWMTSDADTRVGSHGGTGDSEINYKDNGDFASPSKSRSETMELLLAQARQVKEEQQQKQYHPQSLSRQGERDDSPYSRQNASTSSKNNETLDLQKQRKSEEEEEARKVQEAAEEERKQLEKMREEEEEKQLRALIAEVSGNDEVESSNSGNTGNKRTSREEDGDEIIEFETIVESEERLARKRREERRKKLRQLEIDTNSHKIDVDMPRNPAGIVASEMNGNKGNDSNAQGVKAIVSTTVTSSEQKPVQQQSEVDDVTNILKNTPDNDSDDDSFDIFAPDKSTPLPSQSAKSSHSTKNNSNAVSSRNAQDCDDAEGYYKATIGEIITLPKYIGDREYIGPRDESDETGRFAKFRVLGIIGKGVFSSVIKCVEVDSGSNTITTSSRNGVETGQERVIAMKIIRNNEIMAKAAAKEMRILRMLCRPSARKNSNNSRKNIEASSRIGADSGDGLAGSSADDEEDAEERERRERENHNIVRLLEVDPTSISSNHDLSTSYSSSAYSAPPPEFRSHCIFLFEFLPYNLREVLSKFGKNVGINLTAVRSYARQLLCALSHLEKHRVVHADLKPDNILVSANFSTVKLADFGSAFFETDHDNDPTPYLVSRFYRPPEVILGLEYDRMVDLWSTSVTLAELFTGSVLFPGNSNNDMLVKFMDALGPFSHKMVRRHAASYNRMGLTPHFEVGLTGGTYQLRKHDVDRVTGQPVVRMVNVLSAKPDARLAQVMLKASRGSGGNSERVEVMKFADLLTRCLALDPARRLSVRDSLKHEFFMRKKKKDA